MPEAVMSGPEPRRVKMSPEIVKRLSEDWSEPVQFKVDRTDEDGDAELILRTVPTHKQELLGLAEELEARAKEERSSGLHCDLCRANGLSRAASLARAKAEEQ